MATSHGGSNVGPGTQCYYCMWYAGGHVEHCPELTPDGSPERKLWKVWLDIGRRDEAGTRHPTDPVATLGYNKGQYMLEYSQNVRREDYYDE